MSAAKARFEPPKPHINITLSPFKCQYCGTVITGPINTNPIHNCPVAANPCTYLGHRYAYLTAGGEACGICGKRR